MTSFNESVESEFTYIKLRPQDLDMPPDCPFHYDEFFYHRIQGAKEADSWISTSFKQRKILVSSIIELGGMESFKSQWRTVVEDDSTEKKGGEKAAASIARASLDTTKALQKMDLLDMLTCGAQFGSDPKSKKVKWPILSVIFPELGSWNLAPCNHPKEVQALLDVLQGVTPELAVEGECINDVVLNETTWKLFLKNCELCSNEDSTWDTSHRLQVRDKEMSGNTLRNGAIRLYAISYFLCQLVQYSKIDACAIYGKTEENVECSLKRCSRCRCGIYCGTEHQKQHFEQKSNGHKKDCKILKELQERYFSKDLNYSS